MPEFLVDPEPPVTLVGLETLPLVDGNDLVLQFVLNSCHVVPGPIDVDKFCKALAITLGHFPHAAGRLKRTGDDWRIDLTGSPVPVMVVENADLDAPFSAKHRAHVIQSSTADFVSVVPLEGAIKGEDVPLISFKLTYLTKTGETVIGNSWNHVLGDGNTVHHFIYTLSQAYQDLPLPPLPVFHKRAWPDPPAGEEGEELFRTITPHVARSYPLEQVLERYGAEVRDTSLLDLFFTGAQIDQLHEKAKDGLPSDVKVTRQDALSAYITTLHNRCLEEPIHCVMNLMNYRTRTPDEYALYRHPQNAANCTVITFADIEGKTDLSGIAQSIRRHTVRARDNDFVETYLMLNSNRYKQAVKDTRFYMYPAPGIVLVNSLLGLDENGLRNFGYKGKTQYYSEVSWERMFRVHPANPVRAADGSWKTNGGAVVVSLRVRHAHKEEMIALMKEDMRTFR